LQPAVQSTQQPAVQSTQQEIATAFPTNGSWTCAARGATGLQTARGRTGAGAAPGAAGAPRHACVAHHAEALAAAGGAVAVAVERDAEVHLGRHVSARVRRRVRHLLPARRAQLSAPSLSLMTLTLVLSATSCRRAGPTSARPPSASYSLMYCTASLQPLLCCACAHASHACAAPHREQRTRPSVGAAALGASARPPAPPPPPPPPPPHAGAPAAKARGSPTRWATAAPPARTGGSAAPRRARFSAASAARSPTSDARLRVWYTMSPSASARRCCSARSARAAAAAAALAAAASRRCATGQGAGSGPKAPQTLGAHEFFP